MAKGWSFVWSFNGGWRREKATWERERKGFWISFFWLSEEREQLFGFKIKGFSLFLLFYSSSATCPYLSGAKGPTFPFYCDPHSATKVRKNLTFETLKSCLGLRVVSLVPVSRVSLHPSGPVFKSRQYIYQNAQNETPSVVQRLVLLNFRLIN